jgi:hypothetical protein
MVRAKFVCNSVTRTLGSVYNKQTQKYDQALIYSAKMTPVTGGSPENEKFYASTPSGFVELGTYRDDLFEVGKAYFLDFSEATE